MIKIQGVNQNDVNGMNFNVRGDDESTVLILNTPPSLNFNGMPVSDFAASLSGDMPFTVAATQNETGKIVCTFSEPPPADGLANVILAASYNSL
jgi:hypothetical protein